MDDKLAEYFFGQAFVLFAFVLSYLMLSGLFAEIIPQWYYDHIAAADKNTTKIWLRGVGIVALCMALWAQLQVLKKC